MPIENTKLSIKWQYRDTFPPGTYPDLPFRTSRIAGRMWRPTGMLLTFRATADADFAEEVSIANISHIYNSHQLKAELYSADIFGLAVRKNGMVGKQEYNEHLWTYTREDWPVWLSDTVDELLNVLNTR